MPGETNNTNQGQGNDSPAWMSQLPDALKQNENLSQFKTLGDLGNKFLEVTKSLEGTVRIPGENATPEEIATFHEKIGRPKTENDYDLQSPELPEGMQMDTDLGVAFRQLAHKAGLSQKQAKQLFDFYNNQMVTRYSATIKAREKALDDASKALKEEWGTQYDTNMEIVKRAYSKFGNENFTKFLDESGVGNNPVVIKTFLEIGKAVLDDIIIDGKPSQNTRKKGEIIYDNSPDLYK